MACPSSARPISAPPREVLVEQVAPQRPRLEHAALVGDEHPVRLGLGPQLVHLVEQVGSFTGAERFADAGDVGGHLGQRLGDPAERAASARERVADRRLGGAHRPRGRRVGSGVGPVLGDQEGEPQDRDDDERGAEEDAGRERDGQTVAGADPAVAADVAPFPCPPPHSAPD